VGESQLNMLRQMNQAAQMVKRSNLIDKVKQLLATNEESYSFISYTTATQFGLSIT